MKLACICYLFDPFPLKLEYSPSFCRIGHHLGAGLSFRKEALHLHLVYYLGGIRFSGNPLQAKVATYVSLLTSLAIGFVFLYVFFPYLLRPIVLAANTLTFV